MESALCHGSAKDESALIDELGRFPLLSAMFDRRSRRFDVGMSIPDGPFAYQSSRPPLPLSDLEGTLLVLCGAGVSGWHLGMEHTTSGDPHLGCNYPVRLTRRVAASAAGIETSELIVSDDSGTVITRFRDLDLIGEVAQYLHDTFGKFPATIPSVYVRMYAQAQHIDLDYYDSFYGPDAYPETHRQHLARWHSQAQGLPRPSCARSRRSYVRIIHPWHRIAAPNK